MRPGLARSLFLATALAASPARAGMPEREVYVGAAVGGSAVLRGWDLGRNAVFRTLEPRGSAQFGLRAGFQVVEQFGFEVGAQFLPLPVSPSGVTPAFVYDADLLVDILKGDITPFIVGGAGAYNSFGGPLASDLDFQVHLGAGMRFVLKDWLVLRGEIRDVITDGFGPANKFDGNLLELTVGIEIFPMTALGNKDRDHDGLRNEVDKCPDEAGPEATLGCPDRDQDRVADADDQCPDVPGVPLLKGCPDKDGDGVSDPDDACPDEPGPRMLKGCPDKDGDAVADREDECPDQPGPPYLKGCPDRDQDAVPDKDDRCPDQRGLKEFMGCLPPEVERFTGVIQGINFEWDKAEILPSSFPVLDQAVAVLQKFTSMRIQIEGHTDNTGERAHNQKLSSDRAEAVMKYLLDKGVAADRLKAAGFGQDRPIASNETEKGRASNRRVEFNLIAQ